MNWRKWLFVLLFLGLVACESPDDDLGVGVTAVPSTPTSLPPTPIPATAVPSPTAVAELPPPTEVPLEMTATPFVWRPPAGAKASFSREGVTALERQTAVDLDQNLAAARDDVALAMAYKGLAAVPETAVPLVTEPLTVGLRQHINIFNTDSNVVNTVVMELLAVSEHAYFWFDASPGYEWPSEELLATTAVTFDTIYEQDRLHFGSESSPGIDGDPRIHIMNASPVTVCETSVSNPSCGLGGYYASSNTLPVSVDEYSNEREMFVMNGSLFGSTRYLDILAHEFRHMIEDNYDNNDWDWEVEGSAMLAEDLLGFPEDARGRGNQFLANPDQQLNRWTDGNTTPYYGQGYLLNRYLYTQLGPELYLDFATHPEPGFMALDAIAAENGRSFTGHSLWLDWLGALAIHNEPDAPAQYELGADVNTVTMQTLNPGSSVLEATVEQYAADYYQLAGADEVAITFAGSNHVQLVKTLPVSGERMWLANRANYSQASLTRPFDLTNVPTATLNYAVYHEIEAGYDFAYVSISTDGGQTWQGLVTTAMQGASPNDDPSDSAFTERFYSGNSDGWLKETADLTPYVGQVIQIRFEYITDPILTFGGLALDNLSIPEIGFYDDVETEQDWAAVGFVRAAGYVPQQWHLQLVTFANGRPEVQLLTLDENNELSLPLSLTSADGRRPILIVAASAPMTLEPAYYQLTVTAKP
ncbi:MAG: immune inhibitor A [Ardenticatenaceae bacterium]|nr:immune inhibitor A [Ardenticatenaceae bacterium]